MSRSLMVRMAPCERHLRLHSASLRDRVPGAESAVQYAQYKLQAEREESHWWHRGKRRIIGELVRTLLPPSAGHLVVDVGCGPGGNLASLSAEYVCIGMDSAEAVLQFARARFPGILFVKGDSPEALGEAMSTAELFLLSDVLEHVRDDHAMLSRLVASSRPGAYFLVTVPADRRLWSPHDESLGHFRRYDRESLEALWNDLPVTAKLVSYYNSRLYFLARVLRTISRMRGTAWGEAGTDVVGMPGILNAFLERIFRGEGRVLRAALEGMHPWVYRRGVSLIAILRREPH